MAVQAVTTTRTSAALPAPAESFGSLSVTPNPATSVIDVSYTLSASGETSLELASADGRHFPHCLMRWSRNRLLTTTVRNVVGLLVPRNFRSTT